MKIEIGMPVCGFIIKFPIILLILSLPLIGDITLVVMELTYNLLKR